MPNAFLGRTPTRTAFDERRESLVRAAARTPGHGPNVTTPELQRRLLGVCVANTGASSVTLYSAVAHDNEAPLATIAGSSTQLLAPCGIARDRSGRLYVTNLVGGPTFADGSITMYGPRAHGDAPPVAMIAGDQTGLHSPGGIALDRFDNIYVFNSAFDSQTVLVFTPDASGNVKPLRTIAGDATGFDQPNGIAVDGAGTLYVANLGGTQGVAASGVVVHAPGAYGNAAPVAVIRGPRTGIGGPMGVAVDGRGKIYVRNTDSNSVTVYEPGSNGDVAPSARLAGTKTRILGNGGIAVDLEGTLYLSNTMAGVNTVTVYAPDSDGNVPPILIIDGPATGLNQPFAVAHDHHHRRPAFF